mgnify:CR=1 FL=1
MAKLEAPVDFYVDIGILSSSFRILRFLRKLGFKTVVLTYTTTDNTCEIKGLEKNVLKESEKLGLDVFVKANILSENRGYLKKCLRRIRRKVDVVSISPKNLDVARFSGRDRRVDTVIFTYDELVRFYDDSQAKLMSQNGIALEIPFNRLWGKKQISYKTFFFLKRTFYYTVKFRVPIIISSGTTKIIEVKSPKQLISLLEILGLPESYAKLSITTYPLAILKRNMHKRSRNHVQQGVDLA